MPLGAVAISAVAGRWICPWEVVAMSLLMDRKLVMPWESVRSPMVMLDGYGTSWLVANRRYCDGGCDGAVESLRRHLRLAIVVGVGDQKIAM